MDHNLFWLVKLSEWFKSHIHLGIEKLRFKPAYNPYTEPSMEVFSYHEGKMDANFFLPGK